MTSRKAQHLGHDLLKLCCGEELVEVMGWPAKRITQSAATAFTHPSRASQNRAKQDSERDRSAIENLIGGLPSMRYYSKRRQHSTFLQLHPILALYLDLDP